MGNVLFDPVGKENYHKRFLGAMKQRKKSLMSAPLLHNDDAHHDPVEQQKTFQLHPLTATGKLFCAAAAAQCGS